MTAGLLVDFGGVLTTSVAQSFFAFEDRFGLPRGVVFEVVREAYSAAGETSFMSRYERGEITDEEFSDAWRELLGARGHELPDGNLHTELFRESRLVEPMWELVRRAREAGIRTALVSNSWGVDGYPTQRLDECFDELVISGEVGLRKPGHEIYELALSRLGAEPLRSAFIDDLDVNVRAASELGMFGVLHREVAVTARQVGGFFGIEVADLAR